ncbi:MAG: glycoside hydrolase family 3 protein [Deltaproteobacteria bacterium]|nr:glycoside hydrolase family 3 protein [Deltaproteobacteria bacterium]
MSSEDSIDLGSHFIVGLSGTQLTDEERRLLGSVRPSGVIFFKHNIDQNAEDWYVKLQRLGQEAREATGRSKFFLSVDHEGGRVHRLRQPITHFPAAHRWGEHSADVARAMARELRGLGMNLFYGPALDTLLDPDNTVIGARALSSDPSEVERLGIPFIQAIEKEGLVACAKHFPGHGGTHADSHFELPTIDADKLTLLSREILPFRRAIESGIRMIMTAHILLPALDPALPATVSRAIVTDLLRGELGFSGVVTTDALEMRALQHLSAEQKAVLTLQGGTDLFLLAQPYGGTPLEQAERMVREIGKALSDERLSITENDASRARIAKLLSETQNYDGATAQELVGLCGGHSPLCESLEKSVA